MGHISQFAKTLFLAALVISNVALAQQKAVYPEYLARADKARAANMTGLLEDNPDSVLQSSANNFLKKQVRSVFLFSNNCSANFISSEGHALTALHCLNKLKLESVKGNLPLNLMLTPSRSLLGTEVQIPKQNKMQFGLTENAAFGENVKVLALGNGFPNSEIVNKGALRANYSNYNNDWALVKFEKLPSTHTCTVVSMKSPQREDILWSLGYPYILDGKTQTLDWLEKGTPMFQTRFMKPGDDQKKLYKMLLDIYAFYRQIRSDSIAPDPFLIRESFRAEHSLYLSVGKVYRDAKDLIDSTKWPILSSAPHIDQIYDVSRNFTSSISVAGGMSGGGAFNTRGELVGINVASLGGPSIYEDFRMGARHVSVEGIRKQLSEVLADSEIVKAFDCK